MKTYQLIYIDIFSEIFCQLPDYNLSVKWSEELFWCVLFHSSLFKESCFRVISVQTEIKMKCALVFTTPLAFTLLFQMMTCGMKTSKFWNMKNWLHFIFSMDAACCCYLEHRYYDLCACCPHRWNIKFLIYLLVAWGLLLFFTPLVSHKWLCGV